MTDYNTPTVEMQRNAVVNAASNALTAFGLRPLPTGAKAKTEAKSLASVYLQGLGPGSLNGSLGEAQTLVAVELFREALSARGQSINTPLIVGEIIDLHVEQGIDPDLFLRAVEVEVNRATDFGSWPEPLPLVEKTKAPDFPVDALGPDLANLVKEIAAEVMVDPGLAAPAVLATISAAASVGFQIAPYAGWRDEVLVLQTTTIAGSGERKTPTHARTSGALFEAAETVRAEMAGDVALYTAQHTGAKKAVTAAEAALTKTPTDRVLIKALADANQALTDVTENAPQPPRFIRSDATPEAIAVGMQQNHGLIFLSSDEGEQLAIFAGRYSGGRPRVEIVNKGYSGSPADISRSDPTKPDISVPSALLPMSILSQDATLEKMIGNEALVDSGFVARQLISRPETTLGSRQDKAIPMADSTRYSWSRRVTNILRTAWSITESGQGRKTIQFDVDASAAIEAFQADADRLASEYPPRSILRSWVAKAHGQAARIAALLAIFDESNGPDIRLAVVERDHVVRAIEITQFFLIEMQRIDGEVTGVAISGDAVPISRRVLGWMQRSPGRDALRESRVLGAVDVKKVFRGLKGGSGRGSIQRVEDLEPAFELLARRGFIQQTAVTLDDGQRVKLAGVFDLHPLVLARQIDAEDA